MGTGYKVLSSMPSSFCINLADVDFSTFFRVKHVNDLAGDSCKGFDQSHFDAKVIESIWENSQNFINMIMWFFYRVQAHRDDILGMGLLQIE